MTDEPQLPLDDIQGIVVPGFLKPHQTLLGLKLRDNAQRVALLQLLDKGCITTGRQALQDREAHRQGQAADAAPLVALALTAPGLDNLCDRLSATVPSPAFQAGMPARAGLLGDPSPDEWRVGGPQNKPDLLLVVAGNTGPGVASMVADLQVRLAGQANRRQVWLESGQALKGPLRGREHFGFVDNVSQPGLRGRSSADPDSYITPRRLPAGDPERHRFGKPGQDLVWPGEFVLGWPASSPDPLLPGPVRAVPAWMHNGSFLVYRRLRQHVELFHAVMEREAARLAQLPGFGGMTAARLEAMLVGRWPSGAPLSRTPAEDCPVLGRDKLSNNDFRFDDDTPQRQWGSARRRNLPRARADVLGQVCPVASHIRKVNPRDQASDVGGALARQSRRLLRIGVPYQRDADANGDIDRGLQFLSIQASIEDQFEFLQARWINSRNRPRSPGGNDLLVGQRAATPDGVRRCTIFGEGLAQAEVAVQEDFVTPTGGGYFFVPALGTLRKLLTGQPL
jgi:Dyp-type peroxidase family